MNNEISADQINSIMTVLNNAGSQAVEAYSRWYFINAAVWLLVGIVFLSVGFLVFKNRKKLAGLTDDDDKFWLFAACAVLFIIGGLLVADNVTNLFEPTAYGIHQLINDIRG